MKSNPRLMDTFFNQVLVRTWRTPHKFGSARNSRATCLHTSYILWWLSVLSRLSDVLQSWGKLSWQSDIAHSMLTFKDSIPFAVLFFFLKAFHKNIIKREDLERHIPRKTQNQPTRIIIPACTPFQKAMSTPWNHKSAGFCMIFGTSLLFAIPFIVIGALTGFSPAQSTRAQRVWTMGWLTFGLLGILAPVVKSHLASMDAVRGARSFLGAGVSCHGGFGVFTFFYWVVCCCWADARAV